MQKRSYFALGFVGIAWLAACAPDAATRMRTAQTLYNKGDHVGARLELSNVLAAVPGDRAALVLDARNDLALGDGVGGERSARLALAAGLDPALGRKLLVEALILQQNYQASLKLLGPQLRNEDSQTILMRARSLWGLERKTDAMQMLRIAAEERPTADVLRVESGRMALLSGDPDFARREADAVLSRSSQSIEALLLRGEIAASSGEARSGYSWFEKAARLTPDSPRAIAGMAAALGDAGDLDRMSAVLESALVRMPDERRFILLKARLELARNRPQSASDWLSRAGAVAGPDSARRLLEGEIAIASGRYDVAINALGPLVVADPQTEAPRLLLAKAQLGAKDARAAIVTLQPIVERRGASPQARQLYATAAKAAGIPEAGVIANRAMFPDPNWLAQSIGKGNRAVLVGRWSEAVGVYESLVTATGRRDAALLNNLAWSLFMNGASERALAEAEAAYRLAPTNASVCHTLGSILVRTGKSQARGRTLLREAARLAPDNATFRADLLRSEG